VPPGDETAPDDRSSRLVLELPSCSEASEQPPCIVKVERGSRVLPRLLWSAAW